MNIFSFAQQDQSLAYLYSIFGGMNNIIPGTGNTFNILGAMFKVFNSVVLAVGALIVLYVTVMSVVMTAHEGEFMGKKWNNIWIFIRIVTAIALMVPSATGYCAIQYIFMWIIVQGVGAADSVWTAALNYVTVFGSVYTTPTVPSTGSSSQFQGLFQGLVCDATARYSGQDPTGTSGGGYYCGQSPPPSWCSSPPPSVSSTSSTLQLGPNGACGTLTYCNESQACSDQTSLGCTTCQAQVQALSTAVQTLETIANQFVKADADYRTFTATTFLVPNHTEWINTYCSQNNIAAGQCCVPSQNKLAPNFACQPNSNFSSPNDSSGVQNLNSSLIGNMIWPYAFASLQGVDFINVTVSSLYTTALTGAVSGWGNSSSQPQVASSLSNANNQGWIMAGSFYYTIAEMNNSNASAAMPTLNYSAPTNGINSTVMNGFRNNYSAAATLMSAASGSSGSATSTSPALGQASGVMSSSNSDTAAAFSANVSGASGSNPLARLQSTGNTFLIVAETTFIVMLVLSFVVGLAGNIDIWALGNGVMDPIGPAILTMYLFLAPVALFFIGILVTYGGLLAVYAPLIPFVIYVTAAIGWFIAVVEAMVAGPLVALGMLSPNAQQHEIMGKSEAAIGHIFNIFLRPSLMVFGLIAGMLVGSAVIQLIDTGFNTLENSVSAGSDPLGMILFYGAYLTLSVAAINKSFSLIHLIPEQVLTWIGIQGHPGGRHDEGMLSATKGGVEQMGGFAKTGMEGGGGGTKGVGGDMSEARAGAAKKKAAGKGTVSTSGSAPAGS